MLNYKSFNDILNLFGNEWDISWFSKAELIQIENQPIKIQIKNVLDLSQISIFLLLCKNTKNYDYALDTEAKKLLSSIGVQTDTYWCNYKYAELLCGLGRQGKNSLIYNYKFGFDHHITVLAIYNKIIDLPIRKKADYTLLTSCLNCNDCIKACPSKAFYLFKGKYYIDYDTCNNFCGYNNHPSIPALKDNYYKYNGLDIPKYILKSITTFEESIHQLGQPVDFFIKKNGKFYLASFPVCRECAAQKKCSKYDGHYPYDQQKTLIYEVEKT